VIEIRAITRYPLYVSDTAQNFMGLSARNFNPPALKNREYPCQIPFFGTSQKHRLAEPSFPYSLDLRNRRTWIYAARRMCSGSNFASRCPFLCLNTPITAHFCQFSIGSRPILARLYREAINRADSGVKPQKTFGLLNSIAWNVEPEDHAM
jgi:hypothetical protein